jgi:hypothetical protein
VVVPSQNRVIRCRQVPCYGTGSHDLIHERKGNGKRDRIFLRGRRNQVRADRYTRDKDVIRSSGGYDPIYVNDGDTRDKIFGGKGYDKCYVDPRSEGGSGCSRVRVRWGSLEFRLESRAPSGL